MIKEMKLFFLRQRTILFILFLCTLISVQVFAQESNETNTIEENTTLINSTNTTIEEAALTDTSYQESTMNETFSEQNETNITNIREENATASEVIQAIALEKITPIQMRVGEEQLNIVVKNTGTVPLYSVEAQVSGYGITTKETLPIEFLPINEKDYTFTKIIIENPGTIDIVIKIYANGTLLSQEISAVTVINSEEEKIVETSVNEITMNVTIASEELNKTRALYNEVEKKYYEKEKEEYIVYGIKEDLFEIKEYLREAQVAIIEQSQKEFEINNLAAKTNLETIISNLEHAEKAKKTFTEIVSENLALIGSLLGVLISAVTVWSITKSHLKNTKIVNIIKGKQILNIDKETKVENVISKEGMEEQTEYKHSGGHK